MRAVELSIHRISRYAPVAAVSIVILISILLFSGLRWVLSISPEVTEEDVSYRADIPPPVPLVDAAWDVFRRPHSAVPLDTEISLAERFRLAGTFSAYSGDTFSAADAGRRAILDDVTVGRQHLVRDGQKLGDVRVVTIERDSIVLRDHRGEEELFLSFTEFDSQDHPRELAAAPQMDSPVPLRFEDMPTLEENRFGRRIGDDRWIMQRELLLEYADEIQEDPERLTALLMAMQPALDQNDEIQGFVLDMLGENELYEAAGFQDGDIVRMVNSMPMISPARAEYFIGEFLRGNLNAVVIEIERDGAEQRLIHLIR